MVPTVEEVSAAAELAIGVGSTAGEDRMTAVLVVTDCSNDGMEEDAAGPDPAGDADMPTDDSTAGDAFTAAAGATVAAPLDTVVQGGFAAVPTSSGSSSLIQKLSINDGSAGLGGEAGCSSLFSCRAAGALRRKDFSLPHTERFQPVRLDYYVEMIYIPPVQSSHRNIQ